MPGDDPGFECIVVGGGVVGLAVAADVARRGTTCLVVERHERVGQETSSRNSGVVHAGIHHPPEWLKSRLCVEGNRRLQEYAAERGIPYRRCGKIVVAEDDAGTGALEAARARGTAAGIDGLEMLDREALARLEPEVRGRAALLVPGTGIVDAAAFVESLRQDAEAAGAVVLCGAEAAGGGRRDGGGFRLLLREASGGTSACAADAVINAAGLDADVVARWFLPEDAVPAQRFAKGSWFRVASRHAGRVRRLVYPVPPPGLAGLGVHLTMDLGGALRLGPDVAWLPDRRRDFAVDPGRGAEFHVAAARYLPWLAPGDLAPDTAGIRAKLSGPGEPPADFLIREEGPRGCPGLVNLLGIESPGLTAALAIAPHVGALMQ